MSKRKPAAKPAEQAPCGICAAHPTDESARVHRCPTCGKSGYDECCMPGGSGTECVECESA